MRLNFVTCFRKLVEVPQNVCMLHLCLIWRPGPRSRGCHRLLHIACTDNDRPHVSSGLRCTQCPDPCTLSNLAHALCQNYFENSRCGLVSTKS